jgi:hypothetical protein
MHLRILSYSPYLEVSTSETQDAPCSGDRDPCNKAFINLTFPITFLSRIRKLGRLLTSNSNSRGAM